MQKPKKVLKNYLKNCNQKFEKSLYLKNMKSYSRNIYTYNNNKKFFENYFFFMKKMQKFYIKIQKNVNYGVNTEISNSTGLKFWLFKKTFAVS